MLLVSKYDDLPSAKRRAFGSRHDSDRRRRQLESRLSSCQWGYDAVCSLSRTSLSEACGMLDNATYFLDTLLSASTSGSDF